MRVAQGEGVVLCRIGAMPCVKGAILWPSKVMSCLFGGDFRSICSGGRAVKDLAFSRLQGCRIAGFSAWILPFGAPVRRVFHILSSVWGGYDCAAGLGRALNSNLLNAPG